MGLVVGDRHAFLIDDQYAPLADRILAKVNEITDLPLTFVINTHWHGDHSGGNEGLAEAGVIVLAHENVFKLVHTRIGKEESRVVVGNER